MRMRELTNEVVVGKVDGGEAAQLSDGSGDAA